MYKMQVEVRLLKKILIVFFGLLFCCFNTTAQCKIKQRIYPDGSLYYQTESTLFYKTSSMKLMEEIRTDKENYFIVLSPTPFLPKPAGSKLKTNLQVVLSNGKKYTFIHFDSRYVNKDNAFELQFLIDKKHIDDLKKLLISKIYFDDGSGIKWFTLKLHKDALKKQLICFEQKPAN